MAKGKQTAKSGITLSDIDAQLEEYQLKVEELQKQKSKLGSLTKDRTTVMTLIENLQVIALPDDLAEIEALKDGLKGAKGEVKKAYELLFPQTDTKGKAKVRGDADGKSPRPMSPVKTVLKAHPEGLTDSEIEEVPSIKVWLTDKAKWTPEQLTSWLSENIGKTVTSGEVLTFAGGRYFMK